MTSSPYTSDTQPALAALYISIAWHRNVVYMRHHVQQWHTSLQKQALVELSSPGQQRNWKSYLTYKKWNKGFECSILAQLDITWLETRIGMQEHTKSLLQHYSWQNIGCENFVSRHEFNSILKVWGIAVFNLITWRWSVQVYCISWSVFSFLVCSSLLQHWKKLCTFSKCSKISRSDLHKVVLRTKKSIIDSKTKNSKWPLLAEQWVIK